MKAFVLIAFAVLALTATAIADPKIGDTVALYPAKSKDTHYTGVLVKANVIAPCNARSNADDITFDPNQGDRLVKWIKPCPSIPRFMGETAVKVFLNSKTPLWTAAQVNPTSIQQR